MKIINYTKSILFFFILMVLGKVSAQDTVRYPDSCYLFNEYTSTFALELRSDTQHVHNITRERMPFVGYAAPRDSLTIYGIAIVGCLGDTSKIGVSLATKGTGNTFTRHDTAYFGPSSERRFFIFTDVPYYINSRHWINQELYISDFVENCYEIYFDKPHKVADTFYISCWSYDDVLTNDTLQHYALICANTQSNVFLQLWSSEIVLGPERNIFGIAFPILRPYCPRPEVPVVTVEGGEALFGWAEGNPQYELSVARRGTDPDSGSIFATTDTTYSLAGLDSGVWYTARVRAACDRYDSLWWSAWSLPTHFYLGSTNPDSLGIATAAGARFALSPNPAAGQVTVTAEEGLRHVEVYDARGAVVYSAAADGTTAVVETKAWPAGQYVVSVETRAGKGSRVLTVAR